MKTTPVTTSEHTTDATSVPEVNETEAPESATPAETLPAENLPAATEPETESETGAEREPGAGASSDDAAREAELAARRAAVLAGDYSAWSPDLSLSEPAPVAEPQEKPPTPEAIEAVKRIGRDHHTPAAIGRSIIFHGDGYPVQGVIIGSEGNSLAIRVEGGMECLVPPDIQIQYLDARGRVIWTSADLQDQESASEQPQDQEPASEQPQEPEQPQAAGQADPEPAEEDAQENEQPSAALQSESAEESPSADAGVATSAETEREA